VALISHCANIDLLTERKTMHPMVKTIIELRWKTPEELVDFFTQKSDRLKNTTRYKNWTPIQHALDLEKWHGLKNQRTYSRAFEEKNNG